MILDDIRSNWSRALTAVTLLASVVGSASTASAAVQCNFPYPHNIRECSQGTTIIAVSHFLVQTSEGAKQEIFLDFRGGTQGGAAYPVDVTGAHLNRCETTAGDDAPAVSSFSPLPCSLLYGQGTPGSAPSVRRYNHPVNIAFTFVAGN